MQILRKYQLDIIFLFFAVTVIIWLAFLGLEYFGVDPHDYELYAAGPIVLLYTIYLWQVRNTINIHERRSLTGKTLVYWIILGTSLFLTYSTPIPARDFLTIDILFVVFTLFLADSYWDFKSITWKKVFKK
ncbi:MAG: hypothetical protein US58_C0022G0022 [Candidatus Magasanikbacteria bacterium GW2011_GWA2_37_8]|uniref:Uncharacterized protein n=1 Tax=Candidatus Magasanikbacteria bacterium GW2011_GWA2_37_8 TaxID=1619036 RepID=A0A0G0HAH9_9BACT|nr:MAG: hypothetical protein US58_C0022G0022 [Candidatus Magasanikbacteria bacterium GW2011_GWA2_37_8]